MKKRQYHHGNLKESILDAALRLLDDGGASCVTIREVARKAGVSHAAPTNHFRDRAALLTGLATKICDDLAISIEIGVRSKNRKISEQAIEFASVLIGYGLRYPNRYSLIWRSDVLNQKDQELAATRNKIYDRLLSIIIRSKQRKGYDAHTAAMAVLSVAHGYVDLRNSGIIEHRVDEVSGASREDSVMQAVINAMNL